MSSKLSVPTQCALSCYNPTPTRHHNPSRNMAAGEQGNLFCTRGRSVEGTAEPQNYRNTEMHKIQDCRLLPGLPESLSGICSARSKVGHSSWPLIMRPVPSQLVKVVFGDVEAVLEVHCWDALLQGLAGWVLAWLRAGMTKNNPKIANFI